MFDDQTNFSFHRTQKFSNCTSNSDCDSKEFCSSAEGVDACTQCSVIAICFYVDHHAITCTCPDGYFASGANCEKRECNGPQDCPAYKSKCTLDGICVNPCDGVCSKDLICNLNQWVPVCTCPDGMRGNPYINCTMVEEILTNPCDPNPCAENAKCEVGLDHNNSTFLAY